MRYFVSILCLIVSIQSLANETSKVKIDGQRIDILIDETHKLDIKHVLKSPNLNWQMNQQEIPSLGFSPHTYWFRFDVPASTDDWLLELDYALLDYIHMYLVKDQKVLENIETGDQFRFQERPIQHRAFLFPIPRSDQKQTIVLEVRSSSSIQLPLSLWRDNTFFEHDQYRFAEHGLYYGIVLVMALYNFFLFLRLRDSAYAFYVLYVITFAIAQLSLTGFSYQFIWPGLPEWNERSLAVITPLIVTSGMIFVSNFLKLQHNHPRLYRFVYLQAILGIILAALSTSLPYAKMIPLGAALAIFTCLSILVISYYITLNNAYKKLPYKYAIYFSAAWSAFLIGTVVLAMNKFGLLPRNAITESSAQIGSAIEIILLSFALAERLHDANNRRLKAETETRRVSEELFNTQKQQNEQLEFQVAERTHALQAALDKVKLLNDELADLSTMDQVTGVRNRRYFDDMLDREFRRSMRNQTCLSLIMIDLDHFKSINDNYGHLAGDLCLKTVSSDIYNIVKRPPDLVCRYGGEELAVILPETSLDGTMMLAERIRASIENLEIITEGQQIKITASLGVSCLIPAKHNEINDIIQLADNALYIAKENGRNQVQKAT